MQLNKKYGFYSLTKGEKNNYNIGLQLSYLEYNTSEKNLVTTQCRHYNTSHDIVLKKLNKPNNKSNQFCIKSIESLSKLKIEKFWDDGEATCSSKFEIESKTMMMLAVNSNNDNSSSTAATTSGSMFDYDAQSHDLTFVLIGTMGSVTWTVFYIIFHLSLLNYPSIYHTKTVIFCLFLACSANLILATYFSDQYQYIPNAVSLLFSMIHFATWGYHLQINIDAPNVYDLVHFTHRTRKSLLGMDSNYYQSLVKLKEYNASDLSFSAQMQITTEQAKNNAQSIPYRRKARLKQREEQIQRALFANTIKTQNMSGVGQRISYRNFNLDRDSGGLADGLNDPYDTRLHKLLVTLYVILSIIAHFVVVFTSDLYQSEETKFEIIGIYSLFQWMICLSFIVTWYQNFRIEYVTELVLQRNLEKGMGTYMPRIGQGGRRSAKGVSFIRGGHGEEKIATEMAEFEKEFRAISPSHYITNSKNSHISNNNKYFRVDTAPQSARPTKSYKSNGTMIIQSSDSLKKNNNNNNNIGNSDGNNNNYNNNNKNNVEHLRGNTKGIVSSLALNQLENGAPNPPTLVTGKKPIHSDVYGLIQSEEEVSTYYKQKMKKRKKSKTRKIQRFCKRCGMCFCHTLCCLCNVTFLSVLLNAIHYLPWIMVINSSIWIYYGAIVVGIEVIWLPHIVTCVLCVVYIFYSFCMDEEEMVFEQQNSNITGTGGHTRYKTTAANDWLPSMGPNHYSGPSTLGDQSFDYQLMK